MVDDYIKKDANGIKMQYLDSRTGRVSNVPGRPKIFTTVTNPNNHLTNINLAIEDLRMELWKIFRININLNKFFNEDVLGIKFDFIRK